MALNEIFLMLYMIDILYYTDYNDNWGFGVGKSKKCDKQLTFIVRVSVRFSFLNRVKFIQYP